MEKAEHFELLIYCMIDSPGYLDKSLEELRKGVDYWNKKQEEGYFPYSSIYIDFCHIHFL